MKTALALALCLLALTTAVRAADAPLDRNSAEELIRGRLESYLKDPVGAQLKIERGPLLGSVTTKDSTFKGWLVCAQLNGKNSYGGYNGYEPYLFVIEPDTKKVDVLPRMTKFFENVDAWRSACYVDPPQVG